MMTEAEKRLKRPDQYEGSEPHYILTQVPVPCGTGICLMGIGPPQLMIGLWSMDPPCLKYYQVRSACDTSTKCDGLEQFTFY